MNREIKFRAKDYKMNWQYGTYYYGVMYPTAFNGHYVNDCQIDENTLGQYTGLTDKNGKEIYEGDKLLYKFSHKVNISDNTTSPCEGYKIVEIGFIHGSFYSKIIEQKNAYYATLPSNPQSVFGQNFQEYEVIGNIYENPELLK